jgi:hypothetical protein
MSWAITVWYLCFESYNAAQMFVVSFAATSTVTFPPVDLYVGIIYNSLSPFQDGDAPNCQLECN